MEDMTAMCDDILASLQAGDLKGATVKVKAMKAMCAQMGGEDDATREADLEAAQKSAQGMPMETED